MSVKRAATFACILVSGFLFGCNPETASTVVVSAGDANTIARPTPTPSQTRTRPPTDKPKPTWTPKPSRTLTPTYGFFPTPTRGVPPRATPGEKQICPPPTGKEVTIQFAEDPLDYGPYIVEYIRASGNGWDLPSQIGKLSKEIWEGWVFNDQSSVAEADVTGDSTNEILLLVLQGKSVGAPTEDGRYGAIYLFVVGCLDNKYQMLYQNKLGDAAIYNGVKVSPLQFRDVNADGNPEAVYSFDCALNKHAEPFLCFNILGWNGASLYPLVLAPSQSPIPGVYSGSPYFIGAYTLNADLTFRDVDGNGTLELLVSSGKYVRDCEGPLRKNKDIYMWDGAYYRYMWTDPGVPEFRFQAAFDGDYYAFVGFYDRAEASYFQAIHDPSLKTLDTWTEAGLLGHDCSPSKDSDEPLRIMAYARLRLLELYAYLGRNEDAAAEWDYLDAHYSVGTTGYPYASLAKTFWNSYSADGDVGSACAAVRDQSKSGEGDVFGPMKAYGYGNLTPTPETICPYTSPIG
jgi:hypothetical protein